MPEEIHDYLEFTLRLRATGYECLINVGHLPFSPADAGFTRDFRFEDKKRATPFKLSNGNDVNPNDVVRKMIDEGPILAATHPGPIENTYTAQGVSTALDHLEDVAGDDLWCLRVSINRIDTSVVLPEPYASMYDDRVTLPEVGPNEFDDRPKIIQE
ncbi:hypothetical protein [Haloarcula marina]|uniref:hypothetical protein n=1 Tax=Haloarcula marina TaxID=2961574 RepID=UPI0020B844DE|nr:hypothetical protein [Halomicroarcula marina]